MRFFALGFRGRVSNRVRAMTESALDEPAVTAWMPANVPGTTAPFSFDLIAAGGSNLTFRVTDATGKIFALRRPPAGHGLPTAHDMAREFRIMNALGRHSDVPVPTCYAFCEDPAVTGADFYVMSFADGRILRDPSSADGFDIEAAEAATNSLIDTQVAFHTVDLHAVGLGDLGRHDDYVGRQLKRWRGQVERVDLRDLPLMRELHERLIAAKPPERLAAGLAHGDYRFDNTVLGPDNTIVAVLDWELCTTGDPLADFAWSLQYWADPGDKLSFLLDSPTLHPSFIRRDEVARRYEQSIGVDLSDLDYYTVFSWWTQACIVEGAYARRLRGASGGMATTGDVHDIGARVDSFFEHAHELAKGVL
jgi:aminoglycoside phosphotransferase (APT) family kinase protein